MASINLPFAASATRRIPTSGELADGYGCGDADLELFDWMAWWTTGQIARAIESTGNTTDDADLLLLGRSLRSNNQIYKQATGTANALVVTLSPVPTSYAQLRMLLVVATAANTRASVTVAVNALGTRPIVRRGGAALRRGEIQPGPILLIDNGAAYELVGAGGTTRTLLQANLTLYVSTTGSDSNDGLDAAAPFLTLQRAWSEVVNNYDLNGFIVTVEIADGTYFAGVTATGAPIGANSGTGSVLFKSSSGVATAVIIGVSGSNAFSAQGGAQFTLQNMQVQTAGAGTSCLVATTGGLIAFTGLRFAGSVLSHINAANGGFIQATGAYTIAGNASFHAVASSGGIISVGNVTVTLTGTPAFSTAFAYVQQGRIQFIGTVYSGGATGSRYNASENGVITTNGAGIAALPGNAVGTLSSGGQYV